MKIRLALLTPLIFSAAIFSVVSIAPSFAASDRYALVIGNAKYPDAEAPLKEPINDARDVADELKRDGFNVDVGENLTGEQMRRAFDRLYGKIKPGSVALVFFSGFGVQSSRQSYMIPVDAQIWTEPDVSRDGFSLDAILAEMNTRGAAIKIALVDASRRNPFERRFRAFSHGLAPINAPANALILSSATPGKVAEDSTSQNSVLIGELLNHLNAKPMGAEAAFNKTRTAISRASDGEQVPSVSSSLLEEVRFGSNSENANAGS